MGMYDTINGEQVKCFFWVHYYNPSKEEGCHLTTSGGNLDVFQDGDEVPYRTNSYNYTKDFIIVDNHFRHETNRCPKCGIESYQGETICPECGEKMKHSPAVIHIIRDGRVKETIFLYEDDKDSIELNNKLFKNNNKVISYFGEEINVHSLEELFHFFENSKTYTELVCKAFEKSKPIRMKVTKELRKKQNHDETFSEEKFNKYVAEYEQAVKEKEVYIEELREKYLNCFSVPETNGQVLGQYLDALYEYESREDNTEEYQQLRTEFLNFYKEEYLEEFFHYMNSDEEERKETIETIEKYKRD